MYLNFQTMDTEVIKRLKKELKFQRDYSEELTQQLKQLQKKNIDLGVFFK